MAAPAFLRTVLERRLSEPARVWWTTTAEEIARGVSTNRFCALLSLASRHAPTDALQASAVEQDQATRTVPGLNLERWTLRDAARVGLITSRSDLHDQGGVSAILEAFRFADEGECCALLRSLALLPRGEDYRWQAGEGCRSNMLSVFQASACDTPYPAEFFDDVGWNQAVVKCLFVEAPLWRFHRFDQRMNADLARMALDLAEERRSAGRQVRHELWLCLGGHEASRSHDALRQEIAPDNPHGRGRSAAAYALARAGAIEELKSLRATESDPQVAAAMDDALAGNTDASRFRLLDPESPE